MDRISMLTETEALAQLLASRLEVEARWTSQQVRPCHGIADRPSSLTWRTAS
ncbi:hypothetical protein WME99_37995 [Sorangium sp. So ce136]|uniref:hypothetical protein n=1 Tax=Sorangium sp. So ce136 TaxID=3133284 RepID=UPI003F0F63F1